MNRLILSALPLTLLTLSASIAWGQDIVESAPRPAVEQENNWYSGASAQQTSRMIILEKAQMRAHQRIARIESMKWYGYSAARPRTASTPFTGSYGAHWRSPGLRPYGWVPSRTHVIIYR